MELSKELEGGYGFQRKNNLGRPLSKEIHGRATVKVLHLLRNPPDDIAKEMIERHHQDHDHETTIVLVQQAVTIQDKLPGRVLALEDDLRKEPLLSSIPTIDYRGLLSLIFEHDRVICW
jgi:hypothetical protein